MTHVIDIFSRKSIAVKQPKDNQKYSLDTEHKKIGKMSFEEAASQVCAAAAKMAIECDLDTFEDYLKDLMRAVRYYKNLKNQ